jgi:ribosomal protein L11 methyltransferase
MPKQRGLLWELSVSTSAEAEEAVVELLQELFGQPAIVHADTEKRQNDVRLYLPRRAAVNAARRRAIQTGLQRIRACALTLGPARVRVRPVPRENWAESWKRHFRPFEVGPTLLVKPGWSRRRPRRGQTVVVLDPGLSFGTGQHATTRFCLEQIVAARRPGTAQSLLDVGTGSGILAIAAARLGYAPVEGFDCDPEAVRIARANARGNGVSAETRLWRQDLACLPLRRSTTFDVVCANLTADLLAAHRVRLLGRLAPEGVLILAGILAAEFAALRRAYERAGLRLMVRRRQGEWESAAFRLCSALVRF